MSLGSTKSLIDGARLSPELKERLILVLPNLEKNCLFGLEKEINRGDAKLIGEGLTALWESFSGITNGLKSGDVATKTMFWQMLDNYESLLNEEDQARFLYLVADVRALAEKKKDLLNPQEFLRLVDYEIWLFEFLPKDEVLFLLQNSLLRIKGKLDFFKAMQVAVIDGEWYMGKTFYKEFSDALLNNKENLPIDGISTVSTLVSMFSSFSSVPLPSRDSLQVSSFIVKNSALSLLPKDWKDFVADILKTYVWILNPSTEERVIEDFRKERETQRAQHANEVIAKLIASEEVAGTEARKAFVESNIQARPPVVPTPTNLGSARKVGMAEVVGVPAAVKEPVPSVAAVLPNYKKPIAAAPLTAENLAARMAQSKSQPQETKKPSMDIDKKLHDLEDRVKGGGKSI